MPLFPGFQIVGAMSPYEVKRHEDRDEAKQCREYQAKMVKYQAIPQRGLVDLLMFQCRIALGPQHLVLKAAPSLTKILFLRNTNESVLLFCCGSQGRVVVAKVSDLKNTLDFGILRVLKAAE